MQPDRWGWRLLRVRQRAIGLLVLAAAMVAVAGCRPSGPDQSSEQIHQAAGTSSSQTPSRSDVAGARTYPSPASISISAPAAAPTSQVVSLPTATASAGATNIYFTLDIGPRNRQLLQERAVSDGALIRTIQDEGSSTAELSYSRLSDGRLLAVSSTECLSTMDILDPATGNRQRLLTVPETASEVAVSPDMSRIAYLTRPSCQTYTPCPGTCSSHGYPWLPNVLVVLEASTGSAQRTATNDPGLPLFGISWSPDGTQILADWNSSNGPVPIVFNSSHPSFSRAVKIPARTGCRLRALAWSSNTVLAAEGCGPEPTLNLRRLVKVDQTGAIGRTWPVSNCINGINAITAADSHDVLINEHIGYGNGACGKSWSSDIVALDGDTISTVATTPQPAGTTTTNLVAY